MQIDKRLIPSLNILKVSKNSILMANSLNELHGVHSDNFGRVVVTVSEFYLEGLIERYIGQLERVRIPHLTMEKRSWAAFSQFEVNTREELHRLGSYYDWFSNRDVGQEETLVMARLEKSIRFGLLQLAQYALKHSFPTDTALPEEIDRQFYEFIVCYLHNR